MKIQTSTKFNLLLLAFVILAAAAAIQLLKELNTKKEEAHFSGTQVSEMVAKCYSDNLVPVITRDVNGNVIELTCKENN